MLKCEYCERVFEEGDTIVIYGECHCPACESKRIYEAVRCECCGQYEFDDDVLYGVCKECRESLVADYRYNAQKCFDLSKEQKESINLNAFVVSQFSAEEIEKILLKELRGALHSDYIDFIESDDCWFYETASRVKGGESE